jgi:hypothetical protein
MTPGYDKPLYVLPFDHRFEKAKQGSAETAAPRGRDDDE